MIGLYQKYPTFKYILESHLPKVSVTTYHNIFLYLLLWLMASVQAHSQCDGNIGANIFTDGDFGTGTANILSTDPNIAPGYIYTTNVPPFDGFYTITNDLSQWGDNFDCWLDTEDNSNDPNGYMMIVNASYDPGIFYIETVDGLCDNTGYVFSADILNLLRDGSGCDQLDPNVSFFINDELFFETGFLTETNEWETFGFSFDTEPGETSITLSLRNNAPGGFGNDLALDNITFRPCGPEAQILPDEIANICEDGDPITIDATIIGDQYDNPQYQWQQSFDEGVTWVDLVGENGPSYTHTDVSGGFYYYRYLLANDPGQLSNSKCRVFSNTKVIFVQPKFYNETVMICEGTTTLIEGQDVGVPGDYVSNLLTTFGCDSIVTITLELVPDQGIEAEVFLIQPDCYDSESGSVLLGDVQNAYEPFDVFIDGELIPNFDETILSPEDYTITIVDTFGCSYSEDFSLVLPDEITLDIGEDVTLSLGDQLEITPITNVLNTDYTASTDFTCDIDCNNLTFLPISSQSLIVEAIDENLCTVSDTLSITVTKDRKIFIPNIFCPTCNQNDVFYVQGVAASVSSVQSFQVYDRWGNKLYNCIDGQLNDPNCGWDGTFNNQASNPGVYVYVVEIEFIDGDVILYSGDVTVLR